MIGLAKQEGNYVEVYNENGNYMFSRSGELQGFTSTTVAVKEGSRICVYDDHGSYKYSR